MLLTRRRASCSACWMRWVAAAGGAAGSDACADALLRIQAGMLRSQTAIGAFLAFESAFVAAKPPRLFQLQALLKTTSLPHMYRPLYLPPAGQLIPEH